MRIVHGCTQDQGRGLSVQCRRCFKMMFLSECLIDLDGPPYSFYHSACLVEAKEEELC